MARHIYLDELTDFNQYSDMDHVRSEVYFNTGANDFGDRALNSRQQERELEVSPLKNDRNTLKGAIAGAAAGVVGCIAMDLLSRAWISGQQGGRTNEAQKHMTHHGARPDSLEAMEQAASSHRVEHNASTRTAESTVPTTLDEGERAEAGKLVHYAFGAGMGALYGALAEAWPRTRAGWGVPFGLAVWAAMIPVALPAFGLTRKPEEYRADQHAFGVASHVAWGAATESVRRALR